ncbi:MAG: DUF1573 domain-containing protein [Bacteroidia bacterium]
MKKVFLLIFLTLSGASLVLAQKSEPVEKPIITFTKLEHDFGVIYEGKTAEYDFIFTNTGNVPLVLTNVQPGCGCTTPEWPREPIMPGKQGKIKAIYNPGAYKGPFAKGIAVMSNATNSNVQLTIKGDVKEIPKEQVSPVKIDVGGGF